MTATVAAVLLGIAFGAGVCLVVSGLVPAKPTLADAITHLHQPPTTTGVRPGSLDERVGRLLTRLFDVNRATTRGVRRDLRMLEVDPATFTGGKVVAGGAAMLVSPALAVIATLAGLRMTWQLPVVGALALGVAGFFVPNLDVHSRAERRRREFRCSLSGWLNIVTLAMASGEMINQALKVACTTGDGWVFAMLHHTLTDADQRGIPPWTALAHAGDERGLDELSEVAVSVNMAGGGGAKVRATLEAKAAGMRTRALADAQTEANEATTRMILPLVGIAFGFLLLVGYPAVSHIIGGTT